MVSVIFIDDGYLYKNFPLPKRMDRANVLSVIQLEQFTTIQDMLGTCLYTHLEDAMFNQSLTADEAELMKLVKYALAMHSAKALVTFMRSAASAHTNTEANNSSQVVLDSLSSSIEAKASYIQDRIVYYIKNNTTIYGLATAEGCDNDLFNDSEESFVGTGLYYPLGTGLDSEDCE